MVEGKWVKYNQETITDINKKILNDIEPEYVKLYNSVAGHNTLWCTETDIKNAKRQTMNGNVYVYYTNGIEPRILILTISDSIDLIIGVANCQNVETELAPVLEEKLKEFPSNRKYQKRIDDMKKIDKIYNNINNLSVEDLRFIYEIDDNIKYFGYKMDEKVKKIRETRNKRSDYVQIFNCEENEIAFNKEELNNNTICYVGSLVAGDIIPPYVIGDLYLNNITYLKDVKLPYKCKKVYYREQYYNLSEIEELKELEGVFKLPKIRIKR